MNSKINYVLQLVAQYLLLLKKKKEKKRGVVNTSDRSFTVRGVMWHIDPTIIQKRLSSGMGEDSPVWCSSFHETSTRAVSWACDVLRQKRGDCMPSVRSMNTPPNKQAETQRKHHKYNNIIVEAFIKHILVQLPVIRGSDLLMSAICNRLYY